MSFLQRKNKSATEHFVVTHFDASQDGTLVKTEKVVYEQHLNNCRECREWVRRQENLVARLEKEMLPAVVLEPAAAARIQQDLYHVMRRSMIMNNVKASFAGVGAFALLVLAVGAFLWWQAGGLSSGIQVPALLQAPPPEESTAPEQAAPISAGVTQELDDLFNAYQENGVFNGSVLVARGDEIVLSEGFGMADAKNKTPNTPQTRFRIGHITQNFTTVAVLQLQEQGKLTVDDPICQYLAACPAAWEAVTIHQLLNHSSGIADYVYEGGPLIAESTPEQLVNRVIDLPLEFEPGSDYHYSNSGFVILGLIIERVAGQPYLTFLQENIFDPLKMVDSGIDAGAGELAVGYKFGSTEAEDVNLAPFFGTASLYSTVEDLYRFSRALQTEQLLSQASRDQMFEPYFTQGFLGGADWKTNYGNLGELIIDDGRRVFHSPGEGPFEFIYMQGFKSDLVFFPDDDLTIIILENLGSGDPFSAARAVARRVLEDE